MSASKKKENSQGLPSKEALHCLTTGWLRYAVGMMCDFSCDVVSNL